MCANVRKILDEDSQVTFYKTKEIFGLNAPAICSILMENQKMSYVMMVEDDKNV